MQKGPLTLSLYGVHMVYECFYNVLFLNYWDHNNMFTQSQNYQSKHMTV